MMELSWLVYSRKIVVFYAQNKFKLCWMDVVFFIKNRIKLSCSLPLNLVEY